MNFRLLLLAFATCFFWSCNESSTQPVFYKSHHPKNENAPFSDAVQAGDMLFLAGQIGINHTTRTLVNGGISAETEQAIQNIKEVLKQHNLTLNDVVKCTVILSDINDFNAFNEVYKTHFTSKPARTTFAVSGLALNAKIEIDAIAMKR